MSLSGWFIAYLCRWLPHRSPTGVHAVGSPNNNSPVIVTGNFSLTVYRVRRALRGENVWLLVANTEGINVWCAAAGEIFTEQRVIDAITVSRLADKVRHRDIILPSLSAPGMDRAAIHQETGFHAHFGPIYACDIPVYIESGRKKTERMRRFRFDFKHRLDMFFSMNFPIYLLVAVSLSVFWPRYLAGTTILFWTALTLLYASVNIIPGKTGWGQAAIAASLFVAGWGLVDWMWLGNPLTHWNWLIVSIVIFLAGGFDLAGIATPRKSDPEQFLIRIGCRRLGTLFGVKPIGTVTLRYSLCRGCGICHDVCPLGIIGEPDRNHKAMIRDRNACFGCSACVKQCPEAALTLRAE